MNAQHGLYEICEDFYQVRGFDTSNVTFIRGETGWVVIDPLTTAETAAAAYELVTEHLGFREISAVIYTQAIIVSTKTTKNNWIEPLTFEPTTFTKVKKAIKTRAITFPSRYCSQACKAISAITWRKSKANHRSAHERLSRY